MASISKLIKNPAKIVYIFDRLGMSKLIPDRLYLKIKYRASMERKLDLKKPQTYTEKLQVLKLYNRKPEYTKLVDKYEAKACVAKIIGEEHIIPTLGVWDDAEDIDFDALPNQFVLKCTHDSGGLVICRDKSKLDIEQTKRKMNAGLKRDFYYLGREWPYKNVKPRIIAETYMEDSETGELNDFKFYCFDGEPKVMTIVTERKTGIRLDHFDMNFEHLDMRRAGPNSDKTIEKPKTFENMKKLAATLSKGLPHARVDLYEVDGKNYFGEITFFPGNGMVHFEPEEWDYTFGSWIKLPEK